MTNKNKFQKFALVLYIIFVIILFVLFSSVLIKQRKEEILCQVLEIFREMV